MSNIESTKGEIVMYQPDETIRLEVRMESETVWLSQAQMAELFGTGRQAITKHLQNIYECEELEKYATSSILELVRKEGKRNVKRKIEFYNLDVIISVGFRVDTLTMLSNRNANVSATIYTRQQSQNMRQLQLDIQRHNQQYPPIAVNYCQRNHDRFLIIDDVVYVFGASLKDAGKKLFAYIRMQETSASDLLNNIR